MRIINKTHWRTDHLRTILRKAAQIELEPTQRKRLVVEVTYTGTRRGGSSGCAIIGGKWARVRIPKGPEQPNARSVKALKNPSIDTATKASIERYLARFTPEKASANLRYNILAFASVACHEFAHIRGMRHAQMPTYYSWAEGWKEYVHWAQDLPLEIQYTTTITSAERASDKLAHVLVMETRAKTRAKTAASILKKWTAKRKYYARRVAALTAGDNTI